MGNYITQVYWGCDPNLVNETSGMTAKDIYNVQRSWKPIYANARANGLLIFTRLFEAAPETQAFFKYIATATEEEMAQNIAFKAHLINIMSSINAAVQYLDQPEVVIVMMNKLGRFHHSIDVKKSHFMVLKGVLVNILTNDLKSSKDVLTSWGLFIDFMYKHILTYINE